jgi:hypothetical protein
MPLVAVFAWVQHGAIAFPQRFFFLGEDREVLKGKPFSAGAPEISV